MTYKLLNWLFGYDYIHWQNSADQGIARIHTDYNGNVYYWRYKGSKLADQIKDAKQFLWLTCEPEKYLATQETEK